MWFLEGSSCGLILYPGLACEAMCRSEWSWSVSAGSTSVLSLLHSIESSLWQSASFSSLPWPSPQPFSPPSLVVYPPLFFPPSVPKKIHVSSWNPYLILPFENTVSAYYWVYKDLRWAVRVFPDSTKPLSSVDQFLYWSLTFLCQSLPPNPPLGLPLPPSPSIHDHSSHPTPMHPPKRGWAFVTL